MNWKIILASILSLAALAIIAVTAFLVLDAKNTNNTGAPGTSFPSSTFFPGSQSTGAFTVSAEDGTPVAVTDFTHNGETIPDSVNPGSYVLAGSLGYCLADGSCPTGAATDDYSISYDGTSGSFSIVLLTEPLRESRANAEAFLLARLGVSKPELCSLKYYLGVPYFISERFTGENLKFSFCEGAVTLP